jgi:hypothetical protein
MSIRTRVLGVALALAAGSAAAQEAPPSLDFNLHLDCMGAVTSTGSAHASLGNELLVDVEGYVGRLRLPRAMLKPGDAGWRPLRAVKVDEHLVTAQLWASFIHRQLVVIDRVSGHIDFAGYDGFGYHGDCQPYDANSAQKF